MRSAQHTVLALLATLGGISYANAAPPSNDELDAQLQGAWCNSDDGGRTCWGYDVISKGEIRSCGIVPGTRSVFTASAKYEITGSRVCNLVIESNSTDGFKPGYRFCVDVLEIDRRDQLYKDKSGAKAVLYRVPLQAAKCPKLPSDA